MARYKQTIPFNTPMLLLIPTTTYVKGVNQKTYPNIGEMSEEDKARYRFNGACRSFGGTETVINDVYAIKDTVNIETWFRPDIKADCGICILDTGEIYDILGKPENIELRNQYMKFKCERRKGGA